MMLPLALTFMALTAGSFAQVGRNGCVDDQDGCLNCCRNYTIDGDHMAKPVGCYLSHGNTIGNALPYNTLSNHRKGESDTINPKMWESTGDAAQIIAQYCGREAKSLHLPFFGVEYEGECYFGTRDQIDETGQGFVPANQCATRCRNDIGHANTMFIYEVVEFRAH